MADFDLEQLKTLFENLGDRLEKTKGDQLSRDELYRIRSVLTKMSTKVDKPGSNATPAPDRRTIINDVVKEMRKAAPNGPRQPIQSPTPKRNTIINEEKARKKGDPSGNTILDQILRNAGKEANEFSTELDSAGKTTKTFSERVSGASTSFGTVATAAGAFATKMLGVGAERVDFYRELMASGEGTVSSMQDMGRQAAAAGMTVKQFVEAMTKGSQGAKQLGAIKFGDVRKSVVEMSKASGYMGMLPDQITDVTSTYAEILRLQGAGQNRSSAEMASGIMNLVKTSETTAHILGMSREDALKAQAELAKNAQLNAVMAAKGIDPETARSLVRTVTDTYGNSGRDRLLDQLTFSQAGPDSAQFQATNTGAGDAIGNIGDKINSGQKGEELLVDAARSLQTAGRQQLNNKDDLLARAQLARLNAGGLGQQITDGLQGAFVSQGLNTDKNFNRASNQNQNEEQRAGVGALQVAESFNKIAVTGDAMITAVFNPMVDTFGPKLRDEVLPALDAFNEKLTRGAIDASSHTTAMATLGTTVLGVVGGLALFTGGLGIAAKGFSILNSVKGGFRALAGGGVAAGAAGAGAAGAAGAGAAGAAGAGAAGAGAAGAGAGGFLKGAGKALGKAAPVIGGLLEAGDYAFGDKALTMKNLAKTGLSWGGGALGAAGAGLFTGGLGTAVGGVGGYMGGKALGDWMLGPDDLKSTIAPKPEEAKPNPHPSNAANAPENARAGSQPPQVRQRQAPANATGQKGKAALSADQISTKIMEASERSANLLKQIKDNGDKHLEVMREEVAVIRGMSDRVGRLLEEGNRNTKTMADHSI